MKKIRMYSAPKKVDLDQWEKQHGDLDTHFEKGAIRAFIKENELDEEKVKNALFRFQNYAEQNQAKYRNHLMAFFAWLRNDRFGGGLKDYKLTKKSNGLSSAGSAMEEEINKWM